MVAGKSIPVLSHSNSRPLRLPDDGCFRRRLGCYPKWQEIIGNLGSPSKVMALQSKRIVDLTRSLEARIHDLRRKNNFVSIGQPNSGLLHQETGRYEIPTSAGNCIPNPKIFTKPQHYDRAKIPTRQIQWSNRQTVKAKDTTGMAPELTHPKDHLSKDGSSRDRLVCIQQICSGEEICKRKRERHKQRVHGRLQQVLELQTRMGFSSTSSDSSHSPTPKRIKRNIPISEPELEQSILETRSEETSNSPPISDKEPQSPPDRSQHESSTPGNCKSMFAGMENTGWSAEIANWNAKEQEILQSAWKTSTLKTYQSAWTSWLQWSENKGIATSAPMPSDLARYLIYLHDVKKLSAKTILVHKSTVATFTKPAGNESLSSHPIVQKTIKAIRLRCPPVHKSSTWPINELVDWMTKQDIDETSIFQVSQRAATLLLLATGRRIHDLTLLHINQYEVSNNGDITLWPSFGSKTDTASYRQSGWHLTACNDRQLNLCYWIPLLINVSKQRRQADPTLTNLFITTRGKVKAASRTVIAGWIKLLLANAQIKTTPGSFRAAVSSDNWINENMDIDEIIRKGNWQNAKTFLKYYFKEINPITPHGGRITMSNFFSPV